jgi:hypothetical protein
MLGECVLIVSVHGRTRGCVVVSAFLMTRFGWPLTKALDYFSQRLPGVKLKPRYANSLMKFEKWLKSQKLISDLTGWA